MEKELRIIEKKENYIDLKIETERLRLIPIADKYREDIFQEFTSEITVYMYPAPAKEIAVIDDFIHSSRTGMTDGNNIQLVITAKYTEEFLGCAGLHHVDTPTPELGVWVKKGAHGRGYGREAMITLKEWADQNLKYEYLLYPVADKNIASRKIPESLGAEVAREYDDEGIAGNKYHCLEYRIFKS